MYKKHVTTAAKQTSLSSDIQGEYERQRAYLEKTVSTLKRKLRQDVARNKKDNLTVMTANMNMIKEINELRASMKNDPTMSEDEVVHIHEYTYIWTDRLTDRQRHTYIIHTYIHTYI